MVCLPGAAAARVISTMNNKSTKHIGPAKRILPEHFDHLKLEQLHEDGHAVSVNMLVVELCHHDPKYANLNLQM